MIQYAIETKEMDEIMSRLHRLFDIRITFFDMQEHELGYFHVKPISAFCAAFRQKKERETLCLNCDKLHLAEAKRLRGVHIYHCHSGLIEGIVPLYDRKGIYLGAIVFGQLRDPSNPPRPDWSPALKKLYEQLPAYTLEKARDVGHLMKCVSESIIDNELVRYRNKPWAEALEHYIENHLHEKITTEQLAEEVERSASFIAHHFENEFGQTPRQYILKRRMEEAKTLLENGATVQETAERLGFYDAFHFSKTFKRYWKQPPSTCRPT
ncbi:MAG: PocR ligand-binding domain-containing protein [Kiritimatiellales bacterium]|nr:PocR ligand-binding domain-containing protein [Kiritimatiellales bacterium]MCF7863444.1 PocR ligand-binding domain-containing protein [Kiritimatiellales bacterium]